MVWRFWNLALKKTKFCNIPVYFLTDRLTGFQDSWKKLEKWFGGFGILRKADVASEQEDAYKTVEEIMIETKEKVIKRLLF